MQLVRSPSLVGTLLKMYRLVNSGDNVRVRGQLCRNFHDMVVQMPGGEMPVITNFQARKMNLAYAKMEWLWYLGADKYDDSITAHATMWQKLKQPDGSFFSNYGQYIFARDAGYSQFDYVIDTLVADPNSRRACIVLLNRGHLFHENVDTVCTYSINFTIQAGRLHMTVMMRSNDVIFGFTNDAFCFSQLFQFVYVMLRAAMPNLQMGSYTHFANSMHVYERHFEMIYNIIDAGHRGYTRIEVPEPTLAEVIQLVETRGKGGEGDYCSWLKA